MKRSDIRIENKKKKILEATNSEWSNQTVTGTGGGQHFTLKACDAHRELLCTYFFFMFRNEEQIWYIFFNINT